MRIRRPLATALGFAVVAGLGVAAYAEAPKVHVLKVALPDGRVEQIRYTGDTPPRVVLVGAPAAAAPVAVMAPAPVMGLDPFAGFDRVFAMMDAQADAMMQHASQMQAAAMAAPATGAPGGDVRFAALANAPAGAHYSYTTTTIVNGKACTTNVQATSLGAGKQPQLLRRTAGDGCAGSAVQKPTGPQLTTLPAAAKAPVAPTPVAAPKPAAPAMPARDTI